jgi:hypothetical protein
LGSSPRAPAGGAHEFGPEATVLHTRISPYAIAAATFGPICDGSSPDRSIAVADPRLATIHGVASPARLLAATFHE